MNSVKNFLIVAVLAGVGYGVYASLQRNAGDPGQPPGEAQGWPVVPKVDFSTAKSSSGGPLAISGLSARPSAEKGNASGGTAPPFVATSPVGPSDSATFGSPSAVTPGITATTATAPYPTMPAQAAPSASSPTPTQPAVSQPAMSMPNTASNAMGHPAAPPSAYPPADAVRNLAPPPDAQAFGVLPTAPPPAPAKNENPTESLLQSKFVAFMKEVQKALDEGKLAEAHLALSKLYGNPELPADQAKQITDLLDQLAGTVVYSRRFHLEPAYVTQAGDTLDAIAKRYCVPWELLARINGLMPPDATAAAFFKDQPLPVGRELKVVRGPFDAVVHLGKHELTLMLQDRYAGRFPIAVGRDPPTLEGQYTVREKTPNPTYYGPDGVNISPNDPKNPLGKAWIGLTDRVGIHGVCDPQAIGRDDNRGAIGVMDRDLQDLYGILSVGSRVTVVR